MKKLIVTLLLFIFFVSNQTYSWTKDSVAETPSETVISLGAISVALSLVFLSAKAQEKIDKCEEDLKCDLKLRVAEHSFKLAVKNIETAANGNQQIYFADPKNPEQYLVLTYPKEAYEMAANFKQNDVVSFEPSPHRSGWLLKDEQGIALAFAPAPGNEADNYSYLF